MTSDKPVETETACRPEWVHLNHMLSFCIRPLPSMSGRECAGDGPNDNRSCDHKRCLFSARRP